MAVDIVEGDVEVDATKAAVIRLSLTPGYPQLYLRRSFGSFDIYQTILLVSDNANTMGKRTREADVPDYERPRKRARSLNPDHLSSLSDELLLRVLSFLSVPELAKCHRYVFLVPEAPCVHQYSQAELADFHTSTTSWQEIANSGSRTTTRNLSILERAGCPA